VSRPPLAGITVLDLSRLLPGAVCTLSLAELGADVIKVEDPGGGDPLRALPPVVDGVSVYHRTFNRGKRSLALDLRSPEAPAVVEALVARADVVVESFRPKTARRLRVDAVALRARHPRLVHCSVTGYGQSGPYADRPGHDLNFVSLAGLLRLEDAVDGARPDLPRLLIADVAGGAMSAIAGVLAALLARERTGEGATVDISMHEGAVAWLAVPAARRLVPGAAADAPDLPITGREAWYNVYRTADDRAIAVGALEPKFWTEFCERIGRPDLTPLRDTTAEAQARLLAEVRSVIRRRTLVDWMARFEGVEACVTPVNTAAEALTDPHLLARRAVLTMPDGSTRIRTPIRVAAGPAGPDDPLLAPPPDVGAHTDEVLSWAGIGEGTRRRLRAARVVA
jgi:crotonobetainyl-CoA:carnitine CoA-transferase CaiB-like acyl-CoA transferase